MGTAPVFSVHNKNFYKNLYLHKQIDIQDLKLKAFVSRECYHLTKYSDQEHCSNHLLHLWLEICSDR